MSTANIFNLPMCYQYGIGSTGFGAWRELAAHVMTTNWVITGQCPNFPIMYHWRILADTDSKIISDEEQTALDKDATYWENNAPILILDEATSSLDSVTEKYIQDSLHLAIQNRTTMIIAHRLSALLEMDRILVFKDGEMIEDGSHDNLLSANGHYAKMWAMQSNGFLPNDEKEMSN